MTGTDRDYPLRYRLDDMQGRKGESLGAWVLDDGYVFLINYQNWTMGHDEFVYDYIGSRWGVTFLGGVDWQALEAKSPQEKKFLDQAKKDDIKTAAVKVFGWVRLVGESVMVPTFNRTFLKRAADGLAAMHGHGAYHMNFTVDYAGNHGRDWAAGVPWEVLESGDAEAVKRIARYGSIQRNSR